MPAKQTTDVPAETVETAETIPGLSTDPPPATTVICADELGPVSPRTFPPAPAWSPDGHRIKAPLEYSRGIDKTRVYGALRVRDGVELTFCAPSRTSQGWIQLLKQVAAADRRGPIVIITDDLSSHFSGKGCRSGFFVVVTLISDGPSFMAPWAQHRRELRAARIRRQPPIRPGVRTAGPRRQAS